ncbi:hypothetical protein ALQ37_200098 [Pseudomonas syringae pv. aptata]|uniref:Uncharacterized protein n=1 Tax=Pseudomonas syringae pv. aptata TaxID=83167 RepID=A0A3M3X606_PSEAP|nr:hypothetical protein [Pseudomonas syringae]RMO65487.1 hypothetical protein ALQ37_200098 [Pseudomonas syringae pv. aptata]
MHSKYSCLVILIKRAKAQISKLEDYQVAAHTSVLNPRINRWHDSLSNYTKELSDLLESERVLNRSIANEIREMVITITQHLGHAMRETPQGFFVYAGDKVLKISRSGFLRHWFSAESFSGFDDYEFWIENVRLEGKCTPVANHAAYHVSKTNGLKRKLESIDVI